MNSLQITLVMIRLTLTFFVLSQLSCSYLSDNWAMNKQIKTWNERIESFELDMNIIKDTLGVDSFKIRDSILLRTDSLPDN